MRPVAKNWGQPFQVNQAASGSRHPQCLYRRSGTCHTLATLVLHHKLKLLIFNTTKANLGICEVFEDRKNQGLSGWNIVSGSRTQPPQSFPRCASVSMALQPHHDFCFVVECHLRLYSSLSSSASEWRIVLGVLSRCHSNFEYNYTVDARAHTHIRIFWQQTFNGPRNLV